MTRKSGLILVLLVSCLACQRAVKSPPNDLLGVWTTDAPKYEGRYVRFEKERVVFGVGQGKAPATQRILSIDVQRDGKQTVYTVHSVDSDGEHETIFVHDRADGGTLRLKNQRYVVWKKRPPTETSHVLFVEFLKWR